MGVNNLPRVATRQCAGRESNLQSLDHKSNTLPLHYGATTIEERLQAKWHKPRRTLMNSLGMITRGAHLQCLRMASYVRARSQIFLTASLAVLTVECRTDATDSDAIVLGGAALVKPIARKLRDI